MIFAASIAGYLAFTFAFSALIVRMAPGSLTSIHVCRRLWTFPALPAYAFVDGVRVATHLAGGLGTGFAKAFETLSGRKLTRHARTYYIYPSRGPNLRRHTRLDDRQAGHRKTATSSSNTQVNSYHDDGCKDHIR